MTTNRCQALVLEDDPGISRLLETILSREQFDVRLACSASEAIECLAENEFNLIVLDLVVEDHGTDVIEYLKTHRLDFLQAVVVVSAHPLAIRAALEGEYPEPICKYVAKPFELQELTSIIHACKHLCGNGAEARD
jgi:DNA-binding NtrC family response regulator